MSRWAYAWFCPLPENVPELPSILGLHGCLERARFAFYPASDTFYYGPASQARIALREHRRGCCTSDAIQRVAVLIVRLTPGSTPSSSTGHTAWRRSPAGARVAVAQRQYC